LVLGPVIAVVSQGDEDPRPPEMYQNSENPPGESRLPTRE